MAILIPSKNIYNANNPKIIDNVINQVTVEQKIITPSNDYDVAIYTSKQDISSTYNQKKSHTIGALGYIGGTIHNSYISYIYVNAKSVTLNIDIPALQDNKFVSELRLGRNEENVPNIKYTVYAERTLRSVTATATRSGLGDDKVSISNIKYGDVIEKELVTINPTKTIIKEINEVKSTAVASPAKAEAIVEINSFDTDENSWANYKTPPIVQIENKPYYRFNNITFLLCWDIEKLSAVGSYNTSIENTTYPAEGTYEEFVPKQIEVTVYGNTIGINLTEGSIAYGDGNMPYSLNGNELLQDSATVDGVPLTKHLADNILREYKNGKETATILCDISDYYEYAPTAQNLKGNKVISIGNLSSLESFPMTFKIQDQVVPMTFGVDGKDRPMSTKKDGTPKTFVVVGVEMIYDGAVWQKLSLQEV